MAKRDFPGKDLAHEVREIWKAQGHEGELPIAFVNLSIKLNEAKPWDLVNPTLAGVFLIGFAVARFTPVPVTVIGTIVEPSFLLFWLAKWERSNIFLLLGLVLLVGLGSLLLPLLIDPNLNGLEVGACLGFFFGVVTAGTAVTTFVGLLDS